ncbi:PREDICTED: uncharacterized protein LOC109468219 [Branchiostoma belcheri]|uniref:Uncharacterized protein LOC109468219 n=1 Tax=Branchiostoma belcheri TaxID=7741 RepID=A0A6P4YC99_BRABE|nr:PREDICTED: uncharacterized protein LOC109468219 [Branchiostoma belcheri]
MASRWTYFGIAVLLLLVTLTVNGNGDDTERVAKTLERSHLKHLQQKRLKDASVHRNRKDKLEKQFEEKRNQEGWPTRLGRKASFQENDDYLVRDLHTRTENDCHQSYDWAGRLRWVCSDKELQEEMNSFWDRFSGRR